MSYQDTQLGRLAYDLQADLLCCIVEDFEREASEIYINPSEDRTVSDCYYECDDDECVYAVVYPNQLDVMKGYDYSKQDVLEMDREDRYNYLYFSDLDKLCVPQSQIEIRD